MPILIIFLAGCGNVSTPPVVKIGLIAPFEGPSRPLGYSVLAAVRLRLQAWNERGASPRVELVALNDDGDPELSAKLAAQLAADPGVLVVLGPPQSHTARAAAPALAAVHLPTLALAPLPSPAPDAILPFGSDDLTLQRALAPYTFAQTIAWQTPVHEPSIWLGDPLGLAQLRQDTPDLIVAAGPVAAEEAFAAWAGDAAVGLVWAAAVPQALPSDFSLAYQQQTGAPPSPSAALAYAAADLALDLITQQPERSAILQILAGRETPPLRVYQRTQDACCKPLIGE